jgi:hypothetical protein
MKGLRVLQSAVFGITHMVVESVKRKKLDVC